MLSSLQIPTRLNRVVGFLLLLLPFVVYAPVLRGGMVWDDFFLIHTNPFFRSPVLLPEAFRHYLFLDPAAPYYRPIQNWSYFLDYFFWEKWLVGYHLSSILIHALSGILLWQLILRIFRDHALADRRGDIVAAVAAMVWTIHPAHNAAVAYISGRADSLAALFALSGWLLFRKGGVRSVMAFIPWLAALCSRESGLVWLGLFTVYEGWFIHRRRMAAWSLGGLSVVVYAFLRHLPERGVSVSGSETTAKFFEQLWKSFLALGDYFGMLMVPLRLTMERALEASIPVILSGILFFAVVVFLFFKHGKSQRLRRFFLLWFLGGSLFILPVFAKNADSAEHWMYIPSIGLFLAIGCLILEMQNPQRLVFLLVPWILFLAGRTAFRALDWRDQSTFLQTTLRYGKPTARLRGLLAGELVQEGKFDEASKVLEENIEKNPANPLLRIPLGILRERQGRLEEALPYLDISTEYLQTLGRRHPLYIEAPIHKAAVLWKLNRRQESIRTLQAVLPLWQTQWSIHLALAQKFEAMGKVPEAMRVVQDFLKRSPWDLNAWEALGTLQLRIRDGTSAAKSFTRAARLDIYRIEGLLGLYEAERMLGDTQGALDTLEKAFQRQPEDPKLLKLLKDLASK